VILMVGYSSEGKIKAAGTDLPISAKTSKILLRKLRKMKYDRADRFLDGLMEGTENIDGKHHPKAALYIKDVLNSAKNNATNMGFEGNFKITLAVAEKGARRARGKRRRDFGVEMKNTHIKIMLEPIKEKAKKSKFKEQVKKEVTAAVKKRSKNY